MTVQGPCDTPPYEPPECEVVDAALKAIDALLNDCGLEAIDNTALGLLHYINARWDALRAERVVHGEAWAEDLTPDRRTPC